MNDRDGLKQRMTDDTAIDPTEKELHDFWRLRWGIWCLIQDSLDHTLSAREYEDSAVWFMAEIEAIRPLQRTDDDTNNK